MLTEVKISHDDLRLIRGSVRGHARTAEKHMAECQADLDRYRAEDPPNLKRIRDFEDHVEYWHQRHIELQGLLERLEGVCSLTGYTVDVEGGMDDGNAKYTTD